MNIFLWSLYLAGTLGSFLAFKEEMDEEFEWVVALLLCWLWPWGFMFQWVYNKAKES